MDGFLGEIRTFAFTFAPSGWLLCNGGILSVQQYSALFSIIGTTYGGNGSTTFAVPNYQGRGPISAGTGPGLSSYVAGEAFGTEGITVLQSEMPAHNHIVHLKTVVGSPGVAPPGLENVPTGITSLSRLVSPAGTPGAAYTKPPLTSPVMMSPTTIGVTGGTSPHENRQPYLPLIVCICTSGTYPSRN
ncbi:microcystin-dependent protein [Sphingomonas sp. UYAg733]